MSLLSLMRLMSVSLLPTILPSLMLLGFCDGGRDMGVVGEENSIGGRQLDWLCCRRP